MRCGSAARCCPTASRATSTSSTAGSPTSRSPSRRAGRRGLDRPGPGRRALPHRPGRARRGARGRPGAAGDHRPATPARCCCATAARPPTPRWIHEREDLPRLIRAGRHIARTRRYIRNYAHEIEPDELAAYVAQEAAARRRLGQARRGLDRPRRRATSPRRGPGESLDAAIAAAHERRRPGHRARASARTALPDLHRRRHRLHRARHRAVARTSSTRWWSAASRWCRRSCSSTTSRRTPTPAGRSSRRTPTT